MGTSLPTGTAVGPALRAALAVEAIELPRPAPVPEGTKSSRVLSVIPRNCGLHCQGSPGNAVPAPRISQTKRSSKPCHAGARRPLKLPDCSNFTAQPSRASSLRRASGSEPPLGENLTWRRSRTTARGEADFDSGSATSRYEPVPDLAQTTRRFAITLRPGIPPRSCLVVGRYRIQSWFLAGTSVGAMAARRWNSSTISPLALSTAFR